jgi:hypothetical protein
VRKLKRLRAKSQHMAAHLPLPGVDAVEIAKWMMDMAFGQS